jgi:hypothetical protein
MEAERPEPSGSVDPPIPVPPEAVAASGPKGTIVLSFPVTEQPGDRLGRYKLLQQVERVFDLRNSASRGKNSIQ